jgi:hypothetical protein
MSIIARRIGVFVCVLILGSFGVLFSAGHSVAPRPITVTWYKPFTGNGFDAYSVSQTSGYYTAGHDTPVWVDLNQGYFTSRVYCTAGQANGYPGSVRVSGPVGILGPTFREGLTVTNCFIYYQWQVWYFYERGTVSQPAPSNELYTWILLHGNLRDVTTGTMVMPSDAQVTVDSRTCMSPSSPLNFASSSHTYYTASFQCTLIGGHTYQMYTHLQPEIYAKSPGGGLVSGEAYFSAYLIYMQAVHF